MPEVDGRGRTAATSAAGRTELPILEAELLDDERTAGDPRDAIARQRERRIEAALRAHVERLESELAR